MGTCVVAFSEYFIWQPGEINSPRGKSSWVTVIFYFLIHSARQKVRMMTQLFAATGNPVSQEAGVFGSPEE